MINDAAFEEARKRAHDNGIVFEAVLKGHSRTSKRGRKVSFLVHEEDLTKGVEDMEINARYKVVAFEILDNEYTAQPAQEETDESALNSEDTKQREPASGEGNLPARAYGALGGRRRRDPRYQQFIFGISHIILQNAGVIDPMDRKLRENLVAELQHKWCRVASLSHIQPNTPEAERFKWLEAAFDLDGQGIDATEMLEAHRQ